MLKKKLVKHGDGLAIVIDQPLLDLLGLDESSEVRITTNGSGFYITPDKDDLDARLDSAIEDTHRKYNAMLKRLAQ